MKQIYELAEMDVVVFTVEDIITTSASGGLSNGDTDTGSGSGSSDFDKLFPDAN